MAFSSGSVTKFDYAATLAASLAYILLQQRDAVGLQIFGQAVRAEVPPSASAAALEPFCRHLEECGTAGETDLGGLLQGMADRFSRRSLVMLLSDLMAPLADVVSALRRFRYDGHSVVVLQVLDPVEFEFPYEGNVRFEGLEADGEVLTDARQVRDGYLAAFNTFHRRLREACDSERIDYLQARTDDAYDSTLARLLMAGSGGF
jgi:uncharacterized protein (DUF58 family)